MEITPLLPWVYASILVAVHYWGEEIAGHRLAAPLTPLAAGVTVSYVFLELLPKFHAGIQYLGRPGFFALLAGFSLPYIAESFIVQHTKSVEELRKEFKEVHSALVFTYYALIGALIHYLLQQGVTSGTLLFVPVLLHTAVSSLSVAELHRDVMENRIIKAVIMLSALVGVGAASLVTLQGGTAHLLLGLVTGLFLYVVISNSVSRERSGDVRLFLLGLAGYSGLIVYLWQLM